MSRLAIFLVFAALATTGYAQCPITDIKAFAEMAATQHKNGTLANMDQHYASKKPFKIIIENSLAEDDPYEVKTVTAFSEAAAWIDARRVEGYPRAAVRKLISCEKGVCMFDFHEGISHNTLYLNQITYSGTPTCAAVKAIQFLDGN